MVIDKISGSSLGLPSASKPVDGGLDNFNSVLSSRMSAQAGRGQLSAGKSGTFLAGTGQGLSPAKPVKIGTITSKNPTVSDLLVRNPGLRGECWNIVFDPQNREKAYTRIQDGTDIYYNPATKELLWGDMLEKTQEPTAVASTFPEVKSNPVGGVLPEGGAEKEADQVAAKTGISGMIETLVDAVQPLIGKSYSDVNCYELLVKGLSRMGIRYYGRDGLGSQMVTGAVDRGLPMNSYLNGEGLIRFSGSETYRKALNKVSDPAGQAREVVKEMADHLEKGSILSFSTESHGHTGIVSNRNGDWTFINSGVIDNPVEKTATSKGVGEESLAREVENWFRLAARNKESLVITLGRLSPNKLAAYETGKGHSA